MRNRIAMAAAALVLFAASWMVLSYARWVRQIDRANHALQAGDSKTAVQGYEAAAARAISAPPHPRSVWRRLIFNHARALYGLRDYDGLSRMLESEMVRALGDDPELHFWLGNLEYRAAQAQTEKQAMRAAFERAANSYRLGLSAAPDDWDLKYNYELAASQADSLRKKEEQTEKLKRGEMKVLREDTDKPKEPQMKLSPAKRS
ncbi:MAG TPA: hypothetical protein VKB88_24800 [Bryobacteraceae bacterium]|nr:hypothetical protein [Bryobacteraceae bacterium]